mgnify:CR=1 FL=1
MMQPLLAAWKGYVIRGTAEIKIEDIHQGTKLGDGSYGSVCKGTVHSNEVAIKIPLVQELDAEGLELLRKEVEIMRFLNLPSPSHPLHFPTLSYTLLKAHLH